MITRKYGALEILYELEKLEGGVNRPQNASSELFCKDPFNVPNIKSVTVTVKEGDERPERCGSFWVHRKKVKVRVNGTVVRQEGSYSDDWCINKRRNRN